MSTDVSENSSGRETDNITSNFKKFSRNHNKDKSLFEVKRTLEAINKVRQDEAIANAVASQLEVKA